MEPLVSIILPVYNGELYLAGCVDSLLGQTLKDFEIIVVDDGSTDGSRKILERYGERVKYSYQENQGFSAAVNRGISLAKGKYLSFIGQDDEYLPDKLKVQVDALEDAAESALTFSYAVFIDGNGKRLSVGWKKRRKEQRFLFPELYVEGDFIVHSSVMVRKSCLEEFGAFPFDPALTMCGDYKLYLQLARKYPFIEIKKPLVKVRKWEGQLTTGKRDIMFREQRDVILRIYGDPGKDVTRSMYRKAMSNQSLWEGAYCLSAGKKARGVRLLLTAVTLFPLNIKAYLFWLGKCFKFLKGGRAG